MAKSSQIDVKAPVRHTVKPGISTPIFLKTIAEATCYLHRAEDADPTRRLKLFADDEGIIGFHVRPSVEAQDIAKFVIECEGKSKLTHHPLELRASHTHTPEMPFPARERPARKKHDSVRPALSREEGLRLSKEELRDRGYPPRPDPTALAPFRAWLKAVSMPTTMVKPRSVTNTGVSHGPSMSLGVTSPNWSGFELRSPDIDTFESVWGDLTVPWILTGESGTPTHASFWAGIDGDLKGDQLEQVTRDLVQAGTASNNMTWGPWSFSYYYVWTEFLPFQPYEQVRPDLWVNPGDDVTVVVEIRNYDSYAWFLIQNNTTGYYINPTTQNEGAVVLRKQAEWIIERPTYHNSYSDLAFYLPVVMTNAWASTPQYTVFYQPQPEVDIPGLQSRQLTMKNGNDILSQVLPADELSMFFQWSGWH